MAAMPPETFQTLVVYALVIVAVSVAGGLIPGLLRLEHRRMQLALSMVAGVMLGVGLLHMLGHAAEATLHAPPGTTPPSMHAVMLAAVLGFLAMFLLERFFCFHHHEVPGEGACCEQGHPDGVEVAVSEHRLHWMGAFIGLTVHTILAGLALGAAVTAAADGDAAAGLPGFGVFLGIVLHKPFDAFTITALMRHAGKRGLWVHVVNLGFALVVPIGVLIFLLARTVATGEGGFTTLALAFSGGTFICIAASDVLPELQFHRHDRVGMTAMLILGLLIAWGSGLLEGHDHAGHGHAGHGHDHAGHAHDHAGHDHGPVDARDLPGPPRPDQLD